MIHFLEQFTLGNVLTITTILMVGWKLSSKINRLLQNHARSQRWVNTMWEDYNVRYGGTWRVPMGEPSERLTAYIAPKGKHDY